MELAHAQAAHDLEAFEAYLDTARKTLRRALRR
jgi:hypothetical protein